ncbi:MAG: hypothetical protein AAF773_00760 [Cyanobacteria bacterium P01_D01_bin.115]
MATYGSLERDRFVFIGIDDREIVVKDLPTSQRDKFMFWYSRLKVQWGIFSEEFPGGTLQQAYDYDTIGDDGKLTHNPHHYPSIRWAVDYLMAMAGVPMNAVGLDIVYGLLFDWRETGKSVFDHLWVNHPKIELDDPGAPLDESISSATHLLSQFLSMGYTAETIQYCLDVVPQRELQTAMQLSLKRAEEAEAGREKEEKQGKRQKRRKSTKKTRSEESEIEELKRHYNDPSFQARMDSLKTQTLEGDLLKREMNGG